MRVLVTSILAVLIVTTFSTNFEAQPAFATVSTAYTVSDSTTCTSLPLTGGTASWDNPTKTCTIPVSAELFICCRDGALNIASGVTLVNRGDISFQEETRMTVTGILNNYGSVLDKNSFVIVDGIINNHGALGGFPSGQYNVHAGAEINNFGTARVTAFNAGTFVNHVNATLMTFTSIRNGASGVLTNYGNLDVIDASTLFNSGNFDNFGIITIEEGSFTNEGDFNNQDGAIIDNFEFLGNLAAGTIKNHEGAIIINNSVCGGTCPIIRNFGTIDNEGSIINDSSLGIENPGTIFNACDGLSGPGPITGNPPINEEDCPPDTTPPSITAPPNVTLPASGIATDICANLSPSSVTAIGSDVNVPPNAVDNNLNTRWSNFGVGSWITLEHGNKNVICNVDIAWYQGNVRTNDFEVSVSDDNLLFKPVFAGTSSGTTLQPERYEFPDTVALYLRITVNGNSLNNWASITELDVNGYASLGFPVVSDNADKSPLISNDAPATGFPLGTTAVKWTARDTNGNSASATQQITFADSVQPTMDYTSPINRATISGPGSGVNVEIRGTSSDKGSGVKMVEIRTKDPDGILTSYQAATPSATNDWSSWSTSRTFTKSGLYTIFGRVTDNAGNMGWQPMTLTISLSQQDITKPTIAIMAPPNEAVLEGDTSGIKVDINGFAEDSDSGVQQVDIRIKSPDGMSSAYSPATPVGAGDWSSWQTFRTLTQSGEYTIIAKAWDNAGNLNWHSISVTVQLSDTPPDFTKPIVTITSPANGATITGPSSGVTVNIAGAASDFGSGVQKVEIRWFLGTTSSAYSLATPASSGDWSSWNKNISFTISGTYTITAKATDNAGNSQWLSKTLHIVLS
jgi:hypothetical protein